MDVDRFEPALQLLDDSPFHWARRSRLVWAGLALFILASAVDLRAVLVNGFFWLDQPMLNSLSSLFSLRHLWGHAVGLYQPLALSFIWVEHRAFGASPLGYHCVSVVLHASASIFLWLILRRLDVRGAWLAAALFAVLPAQTQAVAWTARQPVLLGALFCLLSIWSYLKWSGVQPPLPEDIDGIEPLDSPSPLLYVASLLAAAAAMLADAPAIALPILLLLLLRWKRHSLSRADRLSLAPFLALALIAVVLNLLLSQRSADPFGPAQALTALQRLEVGGHAIIYYVANLFRLRSAQIVHDRWSVGATAWAFVPLLLIGAAWLGRRFWGAGPLVSLLVFVLILLPGLAIALTQSAPAIYVADHQQYLASAALIAVLAAGLFRISDRLLSTISPRVRCVLVAGIPITCLAVLAAIQSATYFNSIAAFKTALQSEPENSIARAQYALLLVDNNPEKALKLLDDAGPASTSDMTLLDARARVYLALDRCQEAVSSELSLQRLAPDNLSALMGLARAYEAAGTAAINTGRREDAFENFNNALADCDAARKLNSHDPQIDVTVGSVLLHEERFAESIDRLDAAIRSDPACVAARVSKARALFELGRRGADDNLLAALEVLREAIRIDPTSAEAYCALADMHLQLKNFAAAEAEYRAALLFDPDSARVWANLGDLQSAQNRFEEALRSFQRALSLRSDNADALRGSILARAQLATGNHKS